MRGRTARTDDERLCTYKVFVSEVFVVTDVVIS